MIDLNTHLEQTGASREMIYTLTDLTNAFKEIYMALTSVTIAYDTTKNISGDTQLNLDIIADEIMHKHLENSPFVSSFVSEEQPEEICFVGKQTNKYVVAYDPLDGSSVAESGFAVGTIVGIYEGIEKFMGASGRNLAGTIYALYGSHLKIVYTLKNGVHIFTMNENDEIILEKENVKLADEKKMCAFGSMNKAHEIKDLYGLIGYWAENGYSLRYSGSMAADVHHIIQKGGGVFTYPSGKLRLLYECNPMSLLIEEAGGKSSNGKKPILDIKAENIDQRVPIILGSKREVEVVEKYLEDLSK